MSDIKAKYWVGDVDPCDLCNVELTTRFTDGRTRMGSWANMCPACMKDSGIGLGLGSGQQYDKQPDGRWLKTGG